MLRFLTALGFLATLAIDPIAAQESTLFVTSFAPGDKGAIQAFQLDLKTGALKAAKRTTGVENPFYIALTPDRKTLYSIHAKNFGGKENENIAAYQIVGADGELKLLNRQSAQGTAACYLDVDATGKMVLVSNYTSGNVGAAPIKADGSLGEPSAFAQHVDDDPASVKKRKPHAHCVVVGPDNRFAFVADLGVDRVYAYKLDPATGKFTAHQPPYAESPKGSGPRHLTFHPNGKHIYVINEYGNSVTQFDYSAEAGTLARKETISTVPKDFTGKSYCADVKVTPDGKYLYGTNRGHDSIACYRIAADGALTLLKIEPSLGKGPQNLAITPDGQWLLCANMPGNTLAVFRITADGTLTSAGTPTAIPSPSCIRLLTK